MLVIKRLFVLFLFVGKICAYNVEEYCPLTCNKGGFIYQHTVCERKKYVSKFCYIFC